MSASIHGMPWDRSTLCMSGRVKHLGQDSEGPGKQEGAHGVVGLAVWQQGLAHAYPQLPRAAREEVALLCIVLGQADDGARRV